MNYADIGRLHHRCNRLRMNKMTMYSITITFESNHDYNRD